MRTVALRFTALTLLAATGVFSACAGTPPAPVVAPPAPSASVAKQPEPKGMSVAPRICNGRKLVGALVQQMAHRAEAKDEKSREDDDDDDKIASPPPPPSSAGEKSTGSFEQAYRAIAPATVVLQAKGGFGSGVVVDKSGLVLTNYHVVEHGLQKDFTINVKLSFGSPSREAGMRLDEKIYEGVVVKADRVRDMALVKVKDPPANLTVASVSKTDPSPGMPVAAIGHAGIGMMWAIKTCHVAAVGEPARNTIIAAKDCSEPSDRDGLTDADRRVLRAQCESAKKEAQASISQSLEGLFVQSDCRVAPGDSGGPLVNDKAEIVGLNQSLSADRGTGAGTSYHVHGAEIREFIANAPSEPAQVTPDPWCDGGTEATLEDIDLDGKPDALLATSIESRGLFSVRRYALMMDLDERSEVEGKDGAGSKMPFDAEVGFLSLPVGTYTWYDSDNDGRFDLLLSDPTDKGRPVAVYDIDAAGKLTERKGAAAPFYFDSAFLPKNDVMHEHLGRWAATINPRFANAKLIADGKALFEVPDPVRGIPSKGRLVDLDGNGKPDGFSFQSAFVKGLAFDLDEDSLGSLDVKEDPSNLIAQRKLDPELTFIMQPGSIWVIYDTDNDGKHDLAMMADPKSQDRIAIAAFTRAASSDKWTPNDEYVGLKAVRPALLGSPRAAAMVKGALPFYARNEGLAAFPRPASRRGDYDFAPHKKSTNKAVVLGKKAEYQITLFDADNNTKPGKQSANDLVRARKFDAEVAVVRETDAGMTWVYYDTDQDGAYDLVLYSRRPGGEAEKAFRIEGKRVRLAPEAAAGKLYRYKSLFKDKKVADGFKKLATDFLPSEAMEK